MLDLAAAAIADMTFVQNIRFAIAGVASLFRPVGPSFNYVGLATTREGWIRIAGGPKGPYRPEKLNSTDVEGC